MILSSLAFFHMDEGQITVLVGTVIRRLQVDVAVLRVPRKGGMGSGDCWSELCEIYKQLRLFYIEVSVGI